MSQTRLGLCPILYNTT